MRDLLRSLNQLKALQRAHHRPFDIRSALKGQFNIWYILLLHQLPKTLFRRNSILVAEEAQVELHLSELRYDIRRGATRDDARADSDALSPAIERLKLQHLVRQFYDGIASFLRLDASMRGTSTGRQRVGGVALARADDMAIRARGFQDECTLTILANPLHDILAMARIDLFIRDTQETQFAIVVEVESL